MYKCSGVSVYIYIYIYIYTYVLFYQVNDILFIDFNLAAFDPLKFDWYKILNGYINFSFYALPLRMTVVLVETLQNLRST